MSAKSTNLLSQLLVGALVAGLSITTMRAQIVPLSDGNSTASVNLGSQAGMNSWTINGQNQLNQQWFWYRVGSSGPQHSIDTISAPNYSYNANSLNATYTAPNFSLNLTYQLSGGVPGGNDWTADITESITISNSTSSAINFHFFQYSDFMLGGTKGGETANIYQNGSFYSQANVTKGNSQISETIDSPLANESEADLASNTANRLNTISPYTLNNTTTAGPDPATDATWALEWDFSIAAGDSVDVLKDKYLSVPPIPEPGTISLLALGLGGLLLRRSRSGA